LKFRYSKDEVKETNINRIIQKAPFRPLMNSIYSFEYLMIKKEIINADNSLKNFDLFIISAREEFERDRFQNIHLGKIIKEDYTSLLKVKLKILGDRNGIFLKNYEVENNFKKSTLNFIWYDFDQSILDNPIMRVATLISKFINNIGTTGNNNLINCCNFSIEIMTISEERKKVLDKVIKRTLLSIKKKYDFYIKNSIVAKEIRVITCLREIKIQVFEQMEDYLKISAKGVSEVSFIDEKTIDRLENLKEQLKQGKNIK